MITYYAVYVNPKVPDPIVVYALNPQPKYRTFKAAGGLRRFKRVKYQSTQRMCIIVGKTRKKKQNTKDLVDEDLEELEELEELDDLEDDEEDDEEPDDEDDDDEEDDEDEDDDGLDDESVKNLRARARKDGHAPADIRGKNKQALIDLIRAGVEDDDEDDDDEDEDVEEDEDDLDEDEDDDEEDEEETPPKRSKKSGKKSSSKQSTGTSKKKTGPSRSRTTDGKVGVQEVAEHFGTDARKLRMVLRKNGIEKDEDVGRYEWSSLNHPVVKKIGKLLKGGAVKEAQKESLDKLRASKGKKSTSKKTSDAPRKKTKASGTTSKKKKRSS